MKFLHRHLMQLADSFTHWYIAVTISNGVLFFTKEHTVPTAQCGPWKQRFAQLKKHSHHLT